MRASEIMTRRVQTVSIDTLVRDIARLMLRRRISAVPVVDRKRQVVGMVSESDLMRRPESGTAPRHSWWLDLIETPQTRAREYAKTRGLRARDVMTRPIVSVTPDTDVADIVDVLVRWNIKRVPVMRGQRLVGIVSRRDLLPALVKPRKATGKVSDAAISEALRRKMKASGWSANTLVNMAVAKGVVELSGIVPSEDERHAVRVMAETITGVRAVKDGLRVYPAYAYAS
jgi:CBS domain-containing protein